MASLVSATVTPLNQVGVFRVLTQEFLQYRKAVIRNYHSMSDSEEVRWVSLIRGCTDCTGDVALMFVLFLLTQHSGSDTVALVSAQPHDGAHSTFTIAPEW